MVGDKEEIKMLLVSYNLAIKKMKPDFYDMADIIRLNTPWYTKKELTAVFKTVDKPKFVDVNIKPRSKSKKADHGYKELLMLAGKYKVEWVGISNVETISTYKEVRTLLGNDETKICAKIETESGCRNITKIISVFDGVMVDNEDLASEIGWSRATLEKDRIYALCQDNELAHFRLAGVIFEHISHPKVVYTYGVWDLLHPGHIAMLKKAKALGDKLIVGIVCDDAVKKLKGEDRPIQNHNDRLEIIKSIGIVDMAMLQKEYDPVPNMEEIKPDILVKGDDWEHIPGQEWMEKHGGKLVKPSYSKGWSTSETIKKIGGKK